MFCPCALNGWTFPVSSLEQNVRSSHVSYEARNKHFPPFPVLLSLELRWEEPPRKKVVQTVCPSAKIISENLRFFSASSSTIWEECGCGCTNFRCCLTERHILYRLKFGCAVWKWNALPWSVLLCHVNFKKWTGLKLEQIVMTTRMLPITTNDLFTTTEPKCVPSAVLVRETTHSIFFSCFGFLEEWQKMTNEAFLLFVYFVYLWQQFSRVMAVTTWQWEVLNKYKIEPICRKFCVFVSCMILEIVAFSHLLDLEWRARFFWKTEQRAQSSTIPDPRRVWRPGGLPSRHTFVIRHVPETCEKIRNVLQCRGNWKRPMSKTPQISTRCSNRMSWWWWWGYSVQPSKEWQEMHSATCNKTDWPPHVPDRYERKRSGLTVLFWAWNMQKYWLRYVISSRFDFHQSAIMFKSLKLQQGVLAILHFRYSTVFWDWISCVSPKGTIDLTFSGSEVFHNRKGNMFSTLSCSCPWETHTCVQCPQQEGLRTKCTCACKHFCQLQGEMRQESCPGGLLFFWIISYFPCLVMVFWWLGQAMKYDLINDKSGWFGLFTSHLIQVTVAYR